MDPERWRRVGDLFHSALNISPDQRASFLLEKCPDDQEVRQEAESLLSCEGAAANFIESPALDLAARLLAKDKDNDRNSLPVAVGASARFRVLEKLGGGGMGVVYKAEDTKLRRNVALKFLPPESSRDLQALERFQREALAASTLNHPNICTVYDVDEYEGQPFIAMELLEGQTLERRIGAQSLPLPELLTVATQICDGLAAAHAKGMIHRDIKPSNVFLTREGQAKILDFGLAKFQDSENESKKETSSGQHGQEERSADWNLTRTGATIGTAGYMSPEQIRGEALDARTDLFSFGLLLYEMGTGHRAFEGDTGEALHKAILQETPIPVRQLSSRLPIKLAKVINKALEKNRDARYQAIGEIRAELEGLKEEIAPRTRFKPSMGASAALAILLVASINWVVRHRAQSIQAPPEIKFRQLTINSPENPVSSGSISPNGKYLAYSDNEGIHVKDIEARVTKAVTQAIGLPEEETAMDWNIPGAAWFPDSTRFVANAHPVSEGSAWSSRTTSIWAYSLGGQAPHKLRDGAKAWSVSPDGSSIAFGTNVGKLDLDRELWLMAPDGGEAHRLFDAGEQGGIEQMLWSPDAQRGLSLLSHAYAPAAVVSLGLRGEPPVQSFRFDDVGRNVRGDLSWLTDGRLIYQIADSTNGYAGEENGQQDTCNFWTMRMDMQSGKPIEGPQRLTNWTGFCVSGAANNTADGKRLAFLRGSTHNTVYIADVVAGGARVENNRHFTLDESESYTQSWTPDSKNLIFTSNRSGKLGIYKQSLDEDSPQLISDGSFRNTVITPDGKWIFAIPWPRPADSKSPEQLMRIPSGGGKAEIVTTALYDSFDGVWCAEPPSDVCVLGERNGKDQIFWAVDALKGRGAELARWKSDDFWTFHFSPDGTRLAVAESRRGPIHILSLRGQPEQVTPAEFSNAGEMRWTADSKAIYVPDDLKSKSVIWYLSLNGSKHVIWQSPGGGWVLVSPSPDGKHLAITPARSSNNFWLMESF